MKKKTFMRRLCWAKQNYPAVRLVGDVPLRAERQLSDPHSVRNRKTVMEADLVRYWLYYDLCPEASELKVQAWFLAYLETDLVVYEKALESVYELTRRNVLPLLSVSRFKSAIRRFGITPNVLLGPVWPSLEAYLLSEDRKRITPVVLVYVILQWTRLNARMTLDDPSKEDACVNDFAQTQARLMAHWAEVDPDRDRTIADMKQVISSWINDKSFHPRPGHHGSGAVAEQEARRLASTKCLHLGTADQLLQKFVRQYDIDVSTDLPRYAVRSTRAPLVRVSRFLTVPKSFEKRRGIAPQPTLLMWYQQGVLDAFYADVWSSPYIRRHFPIFDRTVNQRLALEGSKHDSYATYDLKAASDSITVHLVKRVFGANVRNCLISCRCRATSEHPDMASYGTMGDASVFPTETIVIGAALKVALTRAHELDPAINTEKFWVFGDDIICESNYLIDNFIHDIFGQLGFIINDDKSFKDGPYRESCGVEAWCGYEVQPWYLFNRTDYHVGRANRFTQLIGAANNAYSRRLKWCREYFLHQLAEVCYGNTKLIPFTTDADDTSKVLTAEITDRGIYRRHPGYQCTQRLAYSATTRRNWEGVADIWEQWYRYYLYLLDPPPREGEPRSFINHDLHIRKKWEDVRLL